VGSHFIEIRSAADIRWLAILQELVGDEAQSYRIRKKTDWCRERRTYESITYGCMAMESHLL
jgi:hypothetical protein